MNYPVIGLCGSHGTGKSTIIKKVKELGFSVNESQISRSAQAMLGWTSLKPAQESEKNMWDLQDAILASMFDRDELINKSGIPTLVDRTPADVWGYLALWISKLGSNVDEERVRRYKAQCRELASRYHRHLIVPIRSEIPFIEEKNRADVDSRTFHEDQVKQFVIGGGLEYSIIQTIHIDYRAVEAIVWLTQTR